MPAASEGPYGYSATPTYPPNDEGGLGPATAAAAGSNSGTPDGGGDSNPAGETHQQQPPPPGGGMPGMDPANPTRPAEALDGSGRRLVPPRELEVKGDSGDQWVVGEGARGKVGEDPGRQGGG
jgi:hypothetical protein